MIDFDHIFNPWFGESFETILKDCLNMHVDILTPQGQSFERDLPETIVPWRDILINDKLNPWKIFRNFQKWLTP